MYGKTNFYLLDQPILMDTEKNCKQNRSRKLETLKFICYIENKHDKNVVLPEQGW